MPDADANESAGFAALCDSNGVVREWLRDGIGISSQPNQPRGFVRLLHESNHEKGLAFLSVLKEQRAAVDWDMCFSVNDGVKVLRVAGCLTDHGALVVGGESALRLSSLCQAVSRSHPRLEEACEAIAAEMDTEPRPDEDISIYEQLMRMYNEFARLQRDYASQNSQLKRLAKEKDRVMNMAVHDLKSPLNAISLMASSVRELAADRLTEPEAQSLERIIDTAQDMGRSLTELLDTAQHKLGEPQLSLVEADFVRLVQERIRLLEPLAARKRIDIVFECESPPPRTAFDLVRLQHVVDNVIGNAIKYSPPGERIVVVVDCVGANLRMRVRDRGAGIPPEDRARIFRPFEIGSTKPTGGEVSNGLGLAICRAVMGAHNGSIAVENRPQGGAEFTLLMPMRSLDP